MPEGDTVALAAARLDRALAGQALLHTEFRVPAFAGVDLSGQAVREVRPRGKHLLLRTDAGLTVHTHLKMEGTWHLYRPGARLAGPDHEIRVVLATRPWLAVGFRLGAVEVFPTGEEDRRLPALGPDVLGPDWDADEVVRRLRAVPDRPLGEALIDQGVMAGPGNVYKSECCFLAGVSPFAPVRDVPDVAAVVALMKRLMEANRGTGSQVTTGDRRPGRARWVYGRGGEPCRRCGTPVRRRAEGTERVTYWCPTCQPPSGATPTPPAARARAARSRPS